MVIVQLFGGSVSRAPGVEIAAGGSLGTASITSSFEVDRQECRAGGRSGATGGRDTEDSPRRRGYSSFDRPPYSHTRTTTIATSPMTQTTMSRGPSSISGS